MPSFSQLKTDIADILGESYLDSQIGDLINRSIRYYQKKRFWFNEESTSITLTASDPVVPSIPSNFQYEIPDGGLVINYSSNRYKLKKVGNSEYDANNTQGTGLPYIYRNRDSSLELYYYPDQAYTLELYYVKSYSALSADGDTNDFTDNAEDLIVNRTLAYVYENFRKDTEMATYYRALADDEFKELQRVSNTRVSTGEISTEDITQNQAYIDTNLTLYNY